MTDVAAPLAPALDDPETWRPLFGAVSGCEVAPVAGGNSPSRLWRVRLRGGEAPPSVIVKQSRTPWSAADPQGYLREARAYDLLRGVPEVAPRLYAARATDGGVRLVLEDLGRAFAFRERDHRWTATELAPVADVFARLHGGTCDAAGLEDPLLMPAPDRRWPGDRIRAAAAALDAWQPGTWRFADLVEAALRRWPAADAPAMPRCLIHADFNAGNVALRPAPPAARLLDWHIAAAGSPGFDVANLFFPPWENHRDLDAEGWLDEVDRARDARDLPPWRDGDRREAFRYCVIWCALSYLPPIARRVERDPVVDGRSAWWRHTARAAHDALRQEGRP